MIGINSEAPFLFIMPLGPKYSGSLEHLQPALLSYYKIPFSEPYSTTGNIILLYILIFFLEKFRKQKDSGNNDTTFLQ